MSLRLNRRQLIVAGGLGFGALAAGGPAMALLAARGFTHGVASGEPGPDRVLLWTRYVGFREGTTPLIAEIAESPDFRRVIANGGAIAGPEADFTAKAWVSGLEPNRHYYYRFVAPDGSYSVTGRTRTLPVGQVPEFRIGVFCCAAMTFGWFNAYGHAARRNDMDLMIHVGDYMYEYPRDSEYQRRLNQWAEATTRMLQMEPSGETVSLADYRLRYAAHRLDPDLQELHRLHPMIAQWDDHEIANDAWRDGAENHRPDQGSYADRKAAAVKAYREWMPVADQDWSRYEIGDLATVFRLETRLTARSGPVDTGAPLGGADEGDVAERLRQFRDHAYEDPTRTMLGDAQEQWLYDGLRASVQRGARWQVLAQQVNIGRIAMPRSALDHIPQGVPGSSSIRSEIRISEAGMPAMLDNWGGFPVARARLLRAAQSADAELVVLAGDSHNAWAFDLEQDGRPAGVEFGGTSVTSMGYDQTLRRDPEALVRTMIAQSPELRWADIAHRGYMAIALRPDAVTGEWVLLDTVHRRTTANWQSRFMTAQRSERVFSNAG
ncbi:alkaline phosphatase D family protein [Sphingomonas flavalba]|uniref:alkaline phosphatase D family protein n=1 Tax=Sphingomonas flavalba TaxID=2559804 RepID=UPI0039E1DB2A